MRFQMREMVTATGRGSPERRSDGLASSEEKEISGPPYTCNLFDRALV
jgi:hypothetical protein